MSYFFSKTLNKTFDAVRIQVEEDLKKIDFGIVSEIDMDQKFKGKLNIDFRRYKILGACSPKHAYAAVSAEEHIGLMLPCNIVLQEKDENTIEVSVIDPIASMQAVNNPALGETAIDIQSKLKEFIESL